MPSRTELRALRIDAVCDFCAEFNAPRGTQVYENLPLLDLVPPGADALRHAALRIEALRWHGRVLVCCALGYSRSAVAVAAWLLHTGRAANADDALAKVRACRPQVVFTFAHRDALREAFGARHALPASAPHRALRTGAMSVPGPRL